MNDLDRLYYDIFESDDDNNLTYESELIALEELYESIIESENYCIEETTFDDISENNKRKKSGKISKVKLIAMIGAAIIVAMALKRFLVKRSQKTKSSKREKHNVKYSDEIKNIDNWINILKKDREDLKKNKDLTEGELKSKENNINRTIKRLIELSKEIQKTIDRSGDDVNYDNSKDVDLLMKYNKDFINILKKFNYNI